MVPTASVPSFMSSAYQEPFEVDVPGRVGPGSGWKSVRTDSADGLLKGETEERICLVQLGSRRFTCDHWIVPKSHRYLYRNTIDFFSTQGPEDAAYGRGRKGKSVIDAVDGARRP
jgi:hypothetical protein